MKKPLKITLMGVSICAVIMVLMTSLASMAQQSDSVSFSLRPKTVNKNSFSAELRTNIQPYKPSYFLLGNLASLYAISKPVTTAATPKNEKALSILKIYPNPVESQLNIQFVISKDAIVSIKIIDLLGNEVSTLFNERLLAGEQTITKQIPSKLNAGVYFLRIIAGNESQIKRISVL